MASKAMAGVFGFCMMAMTGCELFPSDDSSDSGSSESASTATTTASAPPPETATPQASVSSPSDALGGIVWLDQNISGWPQTARLNASVSGGTVFLNYDKAGSWPGRDGLNANAWAFVNRNGTWYGTTWEWLKVGQTAKSASTVEGGHMKKSELAGYRPRSGEVIGFMVSGLIRDSTRNVSERSNIVLVTWP